MIQYRIQDIVEQNFKYQRSLL